MSDAPAGPTGFLKQFRTTQVRVPDPLRPGKRAFEDRLISTGANGISHEGVAYEADEDGWFELPLHVATHLLQFRYPGGERFYTPDQVDEQVRLGALDDSKDAGSSPAVVGEDGPEAPKRIQPRRAPAR